MRSRTSNVLPYKEDIFSSASGCSLWKGHGPGTRADSGNQTVGHRGGGTGSSNGKEIVEVESDDDPQGFFSWNFK